MFEMENSFVARRFMARIQLRIDRASTETQEIDYYRY